MIIKKEERLYLTSEELRIIDEAWRICSHICDALEDEYNDLQEQATQALQSLEWLFTEAKTEEENNKETDEYNEEWEEDDEDEEED